MLGGVTAPPKISFILSVGLVAGLVATGPGVTGPAAAAGVPPVAGLAAAVAAPPAEVGAPCTAVPPGTCVGWPVVPPETAAAVPEVATAAAPLVAAGAPVAAGLGAVVGAAVGAGVDAGAQALTSRASSTTAPGSRDQGFRGNCIRRVLLGGVPLECIEARQGPRRHWPRASVGCETFGEVLPRQTVDEDTAAADPRNEDALRRVVEQAHRVEASARQTAAGRCQSRGRCASTKKPRAVHMPRLISTATQMASRSPLMAGDQ